MATFPCKLVAHVAFKAGGDVFHQIFAIKPEHLMNVTPAKVQDVDLHHGDHGTHGAVIVWKYTVDGKEESCKVVIQDIDEEKKRIAYKLIEGDLLARYKNYNVTFHVETKGGIDFITWSLDYELLNSDNPHPMHMLNFLIEWTKEIEAHIFG